MYLFLEYCTGGELFDRIGESNSCCVGGCDIKIRYFCLSIILHTFTNGWKHNHWLSCTNRSIDIPEAVDGCYDESMLHKPHSLCFSLIMISLLFQKVFSLICHLGVDCDSSLWKCSHLILEPDVGMAEKDAHRFFQQLIAAVVSETKLFVGVISWTHLYYHEIFHSHLCRSTCTVLASPTET